MLSRDVLEVLIDALIIHTNFNISIRKCKTKTSDEHKHCTVQPLDTALGVEHRRGKLLNWGNGSLITAVVWCNLFINTLSWSIYIGPGYTARTDTVDN